MEMTKTTKVGLVVALVLGVVAMLWAETRQSWFATPGEPSVADVLLFAVAPISGLFIGFSFALLWHKQILKLKSATEVK